MVVADVMVAVDVVNVVNVVDNNKIVALEDITCNRLEVLGIICMIFWIFFIAYLASMINTFKIEVLGFLGMGLIFPTFFLFQFFHPAFRKTERKVFKINEIERYEPLEGGDLYFIYDDVNKYQICCEFLSMLKEGDIIEAVIGKKKILKICYVIREKY